ncbi:MAG: RHS repeat-associated core domain-containing protein, partial [Parvibaculaceae bacterium]
EREPHPYFVSEQNFSLKRLQEKGDGRHAVFLPIPRESLAYYYERDPSDPRVAHELTLEVDEFGNIRRSATVTYGRRRPDPGLDVSAQEIQAAHHVVYAEADVTNSIDAPDAYRGPSPFEQRAYEVTGLAPPPGDTRFAFENLLLATRDAAPLPYEAEPAPGLPQKRLIACGRTLYRGDDLAPLPSGRLDPLALPLESYSLALTPGLVSKLFGGRVSEAMLEAGGYVHNEGDNNWWVPSGRIRFAAEAEPEFATARAHFFLPRQYIDPFGHGTAIAYDGYDLLLQDMQDAVGNRTSVGERDASGNLLSTGNDYRVLQPCLITDENGNREAVRFDALGFVAGTAVMGKRDETPRRGDLLEGFVADLPDASVIAHLSNPLVDPEGLLGRATARIVYDLFAYFRSKHDASPKPSASCTIVRETHDADLAPGDRTRVQQSFSYFDGLGRMAQTKAQAEPGPVPRRDPTTGLIVLAGGEPQMTTEDVSPRWVASGWNVLDNKGALARQYEPFFSDRHGYEADTRVGASAVLFHDPLSRPLGVLRADHSWEKTKSGPWRQETWDANDTSLVEDPTGDSDLGGFFRRLQPEEYLPTWREQRLSGALGSAEQTAAEKAAAHAATPSVSHSDSLGRTFLTVVHNKTRRSNASPGDPALEELLTTRLALDIEGNVLEAIDASDRTIMRYGHDMLGRRLHQASMDAGERWALLDVMGKLIHAWDGRGHVFRTEYDALRRHLNSFVKGADPQDPDAEILFAKTEYGEGQPDDAALNLRGNPVRQHDGAGLVTSDAYDFKGNLLRGSRRLARHYEKPLDWRADPELETEVFTSSTSYDALGRAAAVTAPDGSVSEPQYNIRGLLERLDTRLAGTAPSTFVAGAEYSARGQRIAIHYGNGIETRSSYDRLTMRLRSLRSTRTADQALLQALSYTYDSVGNPTHIEDEAQDAIHFANQAVTAASDYTYDAIYRLISAEGREHIGQAAQPQTTWNDAFRRNLPHPGDGQAMRRYSEQYSYDPAGNLLELAHAASGGNWTRAYRYQEVSALEAGKTSNRLSDTSVSGAGTEAYGHDAHGNITAMPHLPVMLWDFKDQLAAASRQPETASDQETTYFVHDWTGRRMRKVTNRRNGSRKCERLYLGGFEIYREYAADGTTVTLERQSLHVLNGSARVALVETLTQGGSGPTEPAVRYQCGNHLESATLELDAQGQVITYEEFYPFGGTSYQAGRSTAETSLKRYRFTAKERDEETGFTDHGARAYAPWLGRWISADPAGLEGGWNLYAYAMNAPVHLVDHTGTDGRIPSRCFDRFNDGQDKIYNPSRCGPITKWKGRRRAPSRGDADGDGGQKRTRRKSSSSGSEDGEAGGVEGGSAGGVQGGRAGATGAVGGKKGGVGMKPGTGTTGSGDTGEGKEGGDSGNPGNDKGSGGSSDKPGNPGGEAKNEGGEGKEAGGKKGGDTQGKQEGPQEGDPGEPGKNPGESTALGTLAQVAALIDDPESLYEAQQSGNKGTGAQMGRKNGLIGGKLGQLLSVIAVFGMVFIGKIGDFFKKIGGGFKKAWNKLFKKEAKQIEKRAVDLLSDYSQKMHSLMGGGLEGAKDFTKKAPTMEIPGDLTVDDLLKYRAMSVEAQEAAAKAEKYTGRYAGDVHDERIVGIDILLERMGHKF